MFFLKSSSSLIGSQAAIERPAGYAGKIVFEAELGIVIGKTCRRISAEGAAEHIFGFTGVNDVTAIELLNENPEFPQWVRSKSFDTFCCLGPVIATDFDWKNGRVLARLDGAERQNYPIADMIFNPYDLVSRISHDLTLLPGDVIACGTSLGAGSMKDGSTVEVEIPGIGVLTNRMNAR